MFGSVREAMFVNSEWWRLVLFFGSVLVSLVVGRLARYFMEKAGSKTEMKNIKAQLLKVAAKPVTLVAFTAGWWMGTSTVPVDAVGLQDIMNTVLRILVAASVGYALYSLVDLVDYYLEKMSARTESKLDDVLAPLLGKTIRITILVLVIINVVHVISGKNITTILAGLGVGGLAVALAGQDTIKNFFGSIVILGDRPFEIGDRIIMDGHDGPVERVGFRSTRIRTLNGHLVTVPNSEMVNKIVQNIGKREYIKRVMNIGVTYDTPPDKLQKAIDILKELLDNHEGMNEEFPARVYFSDYTDWTLNILVIYWYFPPDYWKYMDFSEKLNMEILKRFNAEGIEFAFPTKTVYVKNEEVLTA